MVLNYNCYSPMQLSDELRRIRISKTDNWRRSPIIAKTLTPQKIVPRSPKKTKQENQALQNGW